MPWLACFGRSTTSGTHRTLLAPQAGKFRGTASIIGAEISARRQSRWSSWRAERYYLGCGRRSAKTSRAGAYPLRSDQSTSLGRMQCWRFRRPHSPPLSVSLLFAVGVAVVLVWVAYGMRRASRGAGVVLCLVFACTASVVLNHPRMIERLEQESAERLEIARFAQESDLNFMLSPDNGRTGASPLLNDLDIELARGVTYLVVAPWLVGLAVVTSLVTTPGPIGTRVWQLLVWSTIAMLVSLVVCGQRLYAEYHMYAAHTFEAQGEFDAAAHSLQGAIRAFPELASLERTWALRGKLELRQDNSSPWARYYRAKRSAEDKDLPAAVDLLERIVAEDPAQHSPALDLLGDLLIRDGLMHLAEARWEAARAAFERAAQLAPQRCDAGFLLGHVSHEAYRAAPEVSEAAFAPCLRRAVDRVLRADMLAIIGDAYFEAGRFTEAREKYPASVRAYSLPKEINYRAQKGLSGL